MRAGLTSNRSPLAALTLALTALAGACGGDDDANAALDGGVDNVATSRDAGGAEAPLYAVLAVPPTTMGAPATSYVVLTDSLTGEIKTENAALEIAGSALAAGPAGGKRLFVGSSTGGLVTRYDLTAAGKLEKTGELNFEARQVQNFFSYAANFQFIDARKAYYLALNAAKIVVWDPEALALTGEIPLPQLVRADPSNPGTNYTAGVTGAPIRRGDKLYFFISWDSRQAGTIKVAPSAAVIVVDTRTDTSTVIVDEGTCGYTRDGVVSGDWIYLVTEGAGTAVHYLNPANSAAPCMRRFNTVTQQFDPTYKPDLNTLAGGPAGTLVVSSSGQAFIHVLDKAVADPMIGPETGKINNPRVLAVGALWRPARLTVGDRPSVQRLDLPLTSGSVLPHVLKDGFKVTATFDAQPALREITDDGVVPTARANAKLVGHTAAIVQLR